MTKVERLRRERRLSKRALARQAGVSPDTVLRIETEDHLEKVKLQTYMKLAKALNTHVVDVIEDEFLF